MHILRDPLVAVPAVRQAHPDLRHALPVIDSLAEAGEVMGGVSRRSLEWALLNSNTSDLADIEGLVTCHGHGVYSLPFLDPAYCADLLAEAQHMNYAVNEDEQVAVQIPELFLREVCPQLYQSLAALFRRYVVPLSRLLLHVEPELVQSVQFAKYAPHNTPQGAWHRDEDSDVTLVVALSNEHKGGGTEVSPPWPAEKFTVPQLPVGHAMLFMGRTTLHQGLPVTEGERNLLVHWTTI